MKMKMNMDTIGCKCEDYIIFDNMLRFLLCFICLELYRLLVFDVIYYYV